MRKNPNPRLYTLYVDGKPVSNHAYDFVTAAVIFAERFFAAKAAGKYVEIHTAPKGYKFVR